MCGIFLCIDNNLNIKKCISSLNILNKRGPDYQHYDIFNNNIFMGQTVLNIVGKYDKNNFTSNNQRYIIIFNGEIYNYLQIDSSQSSDTKVLVNMFDNLNHMSYNKIIDKIDGMYCFACYDTIKNQMYISRDMQGEKGIYYYHKDNIFIASSEIQPIINYIGMQNIKISKLKDYFFTRHLITQHQTIYENIFLFPEGNNLVLDCQTITKKYEFKKTIDDLITKEKILEYQKYSNEELTQKLNELMEKTLIEMIPQVPFSSVVSGGIDSTLVSKIINKITNKCYYININCVGKDNFADKINLFDSYFDSSINTIKINESDYKSEIIKCQKILMTPIITHSAVTYSLLSRHLREKKIKVLFTGEGADELFGGYDCYLKPYQKTEISPSNYSKFINQNREKLMDLGNYSDIELKNELKERYQKSLQIYQKCQDPDYYYQAQFLTDCHLMMSKVGCRSTDLMGGLNSIEIRSVFYRKEIMEFILNCPLRAKLNFKTATTKILLKNLFNRYLSSTLVFPKQGFCGFPNDCKTLLKSKYNLIKKYLKFEYLEKENVDVNMEWKFINTELFLEWIF